MAEPFLGQINMFGFNFPPQGWALCDGQLLSISQNAALFSLLGTIYGGNGQTTFGLPELRGRVPLHFGSGPGLAPRFIGSSGGHEDVTLHSGQMPSHTHSSTATTDTTVSISCNSGQGNNANPTGNVHASDTSGFTADYHSMPDGTMAANAAAATSDTSVTINNTGGGQAHTNMQPFLTINFSIALVGLYPSQS